MIAINQGLSDLKLFIQEDYKALRALKNEGLTIQNSKDRIRETEKETKECNNLQEQYKDYLSPKHVETKHLEDLNNLCTFVGVPIAKKTKTVADKIQQATSLKQFFSQLNNYSRKCSGKHCSR